MVCGGACNVERAASSQTQQIMGGTCYGAAAISGTAAPNIDEIDYGTIGREGTALRSSAVS